MSETVINDATASAVGIIYQLYVALEKCFDLKAGESIVVEKLGDVTVPGQSQFETKLFAPDDPLTDCHLNFWKTLRNWTHRSSRAAEYQALVLHTNQAFGERSTLKGWNQMGVAQRLVTLQNILAASEARHNNRNKKEVAESLTLQRAVMATDGNRLDEVLSKVVIADKSADLSGTFDRLQSRYCAHIPEANRPDYLGGLLSFVIRPEVIDNSWEITRLDFENEVSKATSLHMRGTKRFPDKHRHSSTLPLTEEHEKLRAHPFVTKIIDIEHHRHVPQALKDYLYTHQTILSEFGSYSVEAQDYKTFSEEIESIFSLTHELARLEVKDILLDSQKFYLRTISSASPEFSGREAPPRDFKNGVIHMHMNEDAKQLKWRLEA